MLQSVTVVAKTVPVGTAAIVDSAGHAILAAGAVPSWAVPLVNATADPCDDFYEYACGTWLKNTPIPDDHNSWAYSFDTAKDRIADEMRKWMQEDKGTAGILFRSCTDIDSVNKKGNSPYVNSPYRQIADNISDAASLMKAIGMMQYLDGTAFFDFSVSPDNDDPTVYSFYLQQGGISLPDRSYYLDAQYAELRETVYPEAVVKVMQLCGLAADTALKWIKQALVVEAEIATIMKPNDVIRTLFSKERLDRNGLKQLVPAFDWDDFFVQFGYPNVGIGRKEIRIDDPSFFTALSALIASHPAEYFMPYVQWQLMSSLITHLGTDFVNAELQLREKIFGPVKNPPRWRMCHDTLGVDVPQVLAKLYIDKGFAKETRNVALFMLHNLRASFKADLQTKQWLTADTKKVALEKLHNMFAQVAYPTNFTPFPFPVVEHEWFDNAVKMAKYQIVREMDKLGTKVDRQSWGTSGPMEVNAFYSMHVNGIFVPAGILQPPFFTADRPMSWNYGSIGTLIAHELTHGFDDQGSRFDEEGRMKQWWDAAVQAQYDSKKTCFEEVYSSYTIEGEHVNGNLTIGENIADNGGMRIAWLALQQLVASSTTNDSDAAAVTRVANSQFFLAWGQTWCSKTQPKMAKLDLLTDAHSPDSVRVNAVLSNFEPFAQTFQCAAGARMNPASKCQVW